MAVLLTGWTRPLTRLRPFCALTLPDLIRGLGTGWDGGPLAAEVVVGSSVGALSALGLYTLRIIFIFLIVCAMAT